MTFSVFAAAPAAGGADEKVCPMKCCERMKADKAEHGSHKYLCRLMVCSQQIPAPQTGFSSTSIAPVLVEQIDAPGFEKLFSSNAVGHREHAAPVRGAPVQTRPIFIKIHSLLI